MAILNSSAVMPPNPKRPQPQPTPGINPGAPEQTMTGQAPSAPGAPDTGIPAAPTSAPAGDVSRSAVMPQPPAPPNPASPPNPPDVPPGGGLDRVTPLPGGETLTPVPTTQPMPSNVALQHVQQSFTSRFGRAMTPQEQQQAMQIARQNGWDGGGQVPASAINAVMTAMQSYSPPGAPTPGTPAPPAPGTLDPNAAQQQANQAFMKRFGRAMTPQEQQWVYQMAGYTPGQPVTQAMLDSALDAISRYTGNQQKPYEDPEDPTQAEARRRLQELLGLSYGEVDMDSPAMRQQRTAFQRQSQRDTDRQRAVMAERAAHGGYANSGGADVMTDALLQRQGEANQSFEAKLMADELQQQRNTLQEAIALAMETGQQDKARELQERLGTLDIELRKYLGKGQLGLGLLQALMGDQQFYDRLGLDWAQLQNKANSDALMAILNGG